MKLNCVSGIESALGVTEGVSTRQTAAIPPSRIVPGFMASELIHGGATCEFPGYVRQVNEAGPSVESWESNRERWPVSPAHARSHNADEPHTPSLRATPLQDGTGRGQTAIGRSFRGTARRNPKSRIQNRNSSNGVAASVAGPSGGRERWRARGTHGRSGQASNFL